MAGDVRNYETWEERVAAAREEPDPEKMNDFIARQVTAYFREQIIKWFR